MGETVRHIESEPSIPASRVEEVAAAYEAMAAMTTNRKARALACAVSERLHDLATEAREGRVE